MVEIEVMPAKSGDSFLLHFDNGKNILIDMGYEITYEKYIRERLLELKKSGECIAKILNDKEPNPRKVHGILGMLMIYH